MKFATRRSGVACAGCLLSAAILTACGSGGHTSESGGLIIGGWGGAIDKATQTHYITPYQKEGGPSDIKFVDAPGAQLARVEAQKSAGKIEWDAVDSLGGEEAYILAAKGDLATLPSNLKQEFVAELGAHEVTSFGFHHANIGNLIVCNMEKMKTCPHTMAEFFNVKEFPQSRAIPGITPLDNVAAAEEANGVPADALSTTPVNLDRAFATLERIKPKVRVFYESGDQQLQILRSGEADMGIIWSGRAYTLLDEGMHLQINWNQGIYEPSFWTAVNGAPNLNGAFSFMKWIADHPKNEAEWGSELSYSVPNPQALRYLPPHQAERWADYPANYKVMGVPNYKWLTEGSHTAELDSRFQSFLHG